MMSCYQRRASVVLHPSQKVPLATTQPCTLPMQMANLQSLGNNDSSGAYYAVAAGGLAQNGSVVSTADLYNTSSLNFTPLPPMFYPRVYHQLSSLYNRTNRVVATGGVAGKSHPLNPPPPSPNPPPARFWFLVSLCMSCKTLFQSHSLHPPPLSPPSPQGLPALPCAHRDYYDLETKHLPLLFHLLDYKHCPNHCCLHCRIKIRPLRWQSTTTGMRGYGM